MKNILGLALLLATVSTPAFAKENKCAVATTTQIEKQFDKFNDAWRTKKPEEVTKLFADDAVLLATVANDPRTTKEGINDYFVSFLKKSPVAHIHPNKIAIDCNTAYNVGTWTIDVVDPNTGAPGKVEARYSFIYRFTNGEWKIVHLHSSKMPN